MKKNESRKIRAALILVGVTNTEIAKGLNITVSSVSDVISGRRNNPRIRNAIAAAMGCSVDEAFPPDEQEAA